MNKIAIATVENLEDRMPQYALVATADEIVQSGDPKRLDAFLAAAFAIGKRALDS